VSERGGYYPMNGKSNDRMFWFPFSEIFITAHAFEVINLIPPAHISINGNQP